MLDSAASVFLSNALPFYNKLSTADQQKLKSFAVIKQYSEGETLHAGSADCLGFLLIKKGRIRAYMLSANGKELTLYRLLERDICIMSASCIMKNITFEVFVEVEKNSDIIVIPANIIDEISKNSLPASEYINQLMASRFSDVMWIIEQVIFMSFDRRLAIFLLEQSNVENSSKLYITHEMIARHLGSAREVVTRMLKYFSEQGIVTLFRGGIEITDIKKLDKLSIE